MAEKPDTHDAEDGMGMWMEKLPLRILLSTVDAEPISVPEKRKGKGSLHWILTTKQFKELSQPLCFSLSQSPPLAGAPAGIQLTEKENKPMAPRGFLAEYSPY